MKKNDLLWGGIAFGAALLLFFVSKSDSVTLDGNSYQKNSNGEIVRGDEGRTVAKASSGFTIIQEGVRYGG